MLRLYRYDAPRLSRLATCSSKYVHLQYTTAQSRRRIVRTTTTHTTCGAPTRSQAAKSSALLFCARRLRRCSCSGQLGLVLTYPGLRPLAPCRYRLLLGSSMSAGGGAAFIEPTPSPTPRRDIARGLDAIALSLDTLMCRPSIYVQGAKDSICRNVCNTTVTCKVPTRSPTSEVLHYSRHVVQTRVIACRRGSRVARPP